MSAIVSAADVRRSRVRLFIVTMLFLVTTVNYADRATLSIAGPALSKELTSIPSPWATCSRPSAGPM